MGEREFIAIMAALTASTAIGVDLMLPALGEIRSSFGLTPDATVVSWAVSGYILGMGVAQALFGPFSDRFGRKPVIYAGLGLYMLGAVGSTLANSLSFLLVSRVIWGIGAAAPRSTSVAMLRDTYSGDKMARALTQVMAVFLIGPIVGPALGELILRNSSWRWVFGFSVAFAGVLLLWLLRLDETLKPSHRRPLGARRTLEALRLICRSRPTLAFGLALTFEYGAFIAFLSSSELLFSDVYGRGDQFAMLFGAGAVLMVIAALNSARAIRLFGSDRVLATAAVAYIGLAAALSVVSALGGGSPSFWVWFVPLTLLNALHVVIGPISNSMAMTPMGEIAGTASSVLGSFSLGIGSLLAAIPNRLSQGSVTPLSLSYLIYGALAVGCLFWGLTSLRRSAGSPPGSDGMSG